MENIEKYKELPEEVYDRFDELSDEAYELFEEKKYEESFKKYEECLSIIPDPKKDYGEASGVIEWIVENYLKIEDFQNAISWVERLGDYLKNKEIMGDLEFLKGKVYFGSGELTKAHENFKIAFAKTKGSCFKEQDPQYLDFYQNPEKYSKS